MSDEDRSRLARVRDILQTIRLGPAAHWLDPGERETLALELATQHGEWLADLAEKALSPSAAVCPACSGRGRRLEGYEMHSCGFCGGTGRAK